MFFTIQVIKLINKIVDFFLFKTIFDLKSALPIFFIRGFITIYPMVPYVKGIIFLFIKLPQQLHLTSYALPTLSLQVVALSERGKESGNLLLGDYNLRRCGLVRTDGGGDCVGVQHNTEEYTL